MSEPTHTNSDESTSVEELNDAGLGATTGAKDTFEPEESETDGEGDA